MQPKLSPPKTCTSPAARTVNYPHPMRLHALTTLLLLVAPMTLPAQSPQPVPTLKLNARLILLDVTVRDSKGNPVPNLTAKDFAIFEDKLPQTISSFEPTTTHTLPATSTRTTLFDPASPTAFGTSAVTMLVLDEVNTHFTDTVYAKDQLIHYLATQPETLAQPTTLLVVRDHRFEQLAPYTLDRDTLLTALKHHVPEQAWQLEQSMSVGQGVAERLDNSLAALEQLAQYSTRIPGHKNLIWIGAGFPSVDPTGLMAETTEELRRLLQHVTDTLLEDRVSLYAVDPTTTAATTTEITDPDQLDFAQAAAEGAGRILDPFNRTLGFDTLGPVTGGKVIRQRNDVDVQIAQSIIQGSTYYTLGYRPAADSTAPRQFRHIRVVCLRPGLTVATHDGYYTTGPATALTRDTVAYDLNNAATASIPLHAVAFTVTPGANVFTLHVHAADLSWKQNQATAEILVVALAQNGKILAHTLHTETASAAAEVNTTDPTQTAAFTITITPPPKTAKLRFIVRDQTTARMGTEDLPWHP